MSIVIKAPSGGGSISLDTQQSVTGDHTLQLPTGVGSAGQVLKNSSTAGTLEFAQGGKILQVVQSSKTDVDSITGASFQNIGLSVSITPSSATSKVLIFVYATISSDNGSYDMKLRLMRGTTPLSVGDAASNRPRASTNISNSWASGVWGSANAAINFLDSPATTSQVTYKLQAMAYGATYNIYINRGPNDTDLAGYEARSASSMIAMEVEA